MGQDNTFKEKFYLVLAGIFISSLVTCNLIANKFVTVDFGFKVFIVSAGILPYPLTFLVTDLISELYGQKKANLVGFSGFVASLFVLLFLWLGGLPTHHHQIGFLGYIKQSPAQCLIFLIMKIQSLILS